VISHAQYAADEGGGENAGTTNAKSEAPANNAMLTDGMEASSPPTDAVNINTPSMASSPMSPDSGADGSATEKARTDASDKPTAATPAVNTLSSAGGIEETPTHLARTPHFDAHRFEKVGPMYFIRLRHFFFGLMIFVNLLNPFSTLSNFS